MSNLSDDFNKVANKYCHSLHMSMCDLGHKLNSPEHFRRQLMNELIDRVITRIKKGWCKGTAHRNAKGEPCFQRESVACCIVGACGLETQLPHQYDNLLNLIRDKAQKKYGRYVDIGPLNDDLLGSQEKVIEFLESCKT